MSFAFIFLSILSIFHLVTSLSIPRDGLGCPEKNPLAAAYYTSWHADEGAPLKSVSWEKYDMLIFAFAETTPSVHNLSVTDATLLSKFVSDAHDHSVGAHLSVGGWSGSKHFSSNVATTENRTAFAQTVIDLVNQYNLDGISIDWEYPGKQSIGCNEVSVNDTLNFLSFLQELRKDPVGAQMIITASVPITTFVNASGDPTPDVSGFADVLDYIFLMSYDIYGPWSVAVGPTSPLNDTCAPPAYQAGSLVTAVEAWTRAGVPATQLFAGLATYGYSYNVSVEDAFAADGSLAAYPKFNASNQPPGDSRDDVGSINVCGVFQKPGGTYNYRGLIEGGFLTENGNLETEIYYRYDECSQTPFIYNKTSGVMVSYDNPESFTAKGRFVANNKMGGFVLWEEGGDCDDALIDAARNGAGING